MRFRVRFSPLTDRYGALHPFRPPPGTYMGRKDLASHRDLSRAMYRDMGDVALYDESPCTPATGSQKFGLQCFRGGRSPATSLALLTPEG